MGVSKPPKRTRVPKDTPCKRNKKWIQLHDEDLWYKIVNLERRVITQIQRLKYCSLIPPYCWKSSIIMIFFLVIVFHQSPLSLELFKIMKLMKKRLECVHLIKLWFSNLDINNFGWKHAMATPFVLSYCIFFGWSFWTYTM